MVFASLFSLLPWSCCNQTGMAVVYRDRGLALAALLCMIGITFASGGMHMDEPASYADSQLEALHANWRSRAFHWLSSLFMLVILPSIAAAYSVANRHSVSLFLQIISAIYSVIEAIFLRFNDPDGHENITSRGTAWFLSFFYCLVIFNGSISYGKIEFQDSIDTTRLRFLLIPFNVLSYKIMSGLLVLNGLIKLSMNVVALLGFCYDSHTGQCNAHGIMGMSFVVYGFILTLVLVIPWIRNHKGKYSQEFYDSVVITLWGIINTFTEHRPWEPWSHGDYQHTSMGIIFWCCGMLGIYLSWNGKRNFIPALTLIFIGYAMVEHVQLLIVSTKVHGFFGYVLMFGGICRIIEISFLLNDDVNYGDIKSFQYLSPFALILAGILFMSANEEQLQLVVNLGADHSSYILVIASAACVLQLWILLVLELYLKLVNNNNSNTSKYQGIPNDIHMETEAGNFELESDLESRL